MKKTVKTVVSIALCLSVLLCLGISSFAASADNVQKYSLYTCFGDSIPATFHEDGYQTLGFRELEGTYPSIVRKACCAQLNTYAYAGFASEQLRYWFDPSYVMDPYTMWVRPEECSVATMDAMRGEVMESILNSGLITINIGSNDVFSLPMSEAGAADYSMYEGTGIEALDALTEPVRSAAMLNAFIANYSDAVDRRFTAFNDNMDVVLSGTRALNKDAEILLIGMYNPFDGMPLTAESQLAFGDLGYTVVTRMNSMMQSLAKKYDCVFVDVLDTETYYTGSGYAMTDEETLATVSDYIHPTPAGHRYIAKQIFRVLPLRPHYPIVLKGISRADTVYLDGVPYPAEIIGGKVSVYADDTCFRTAAVCGSSGITRVWKLNFFNGEYTAGKALSQSLPSTPGISAAVVARPAACPDAKESGVVPVPVKNSVSGPEPLFSRSPGSVRRVAISPAVTGTGRKGSVRLFEK